MQLLFCKYSRGFGGETPIAEEEAKPDDETKGLRVSAQFPNRPGPHGTQAAFAPFRPSTSQARTASPAASNSQAQAGSSVATLMSVVR